MTLNILDGTHATCSELQRWAAEAQQRLAAEIREAKLTTASEIIAYLARQTYPAVLSIEREDWDESCWQRGNSAPMQINYRHGQQLAGPASPIGEYMLDVAVPTHGDVIYRGVGA